MIRARQITDVYSRLARALSLLLAGMLAAMVTLYPPALARMEHGAISLVVWGICAGFVYGIGFVPDSRLWRALFSPWLAWLLMGFGVMRMAGL